jgi:hypothetical protein
MSNAAPGYRLHDAEIGYPCFRQLTASLTQFFDGRKSRTPYKPENGQKPVDLTNEAFRKLKRSGP